MKAILCYGDSNTWGYVPGKANPVTLYIERYPRDIRWTGRLQKLLGNDYYIIEEGLNGRTTNLESPQPPNRNGKTQLLPCLYSHAPLDLVIFMLGANDLKDYYYRSAADIAQGLAELVELTQATLYGPDMQSPPQILLIGYPELSHDHFGEPMGDPDLFKNGTARSKEFHEHFSKVAEHYHCHYLNVAHKVKLSEIDGLHLDAEGHQNLASLIAPKIKSIFSES